MALKLTVKATSKSTSAPTPAEASEVATKFRRESMELETVEAKVKLLRANLLEIMEDYRNDRLRNGVAETSVSIPTTDGNKVMVVYPEKFKVLSDENIPALQEAFGSNYSLYVEEIEELNLLEGVSVSSIRAAAGKNADAVMALFDVKRTVKPRKGAFNNIAELFKSGKHNVAEDLTTFVSATIGSPQVRK
jgi:hypothetical protein